ncbi:hypothetical protein D9757_007488 [Collybiopsis confluens]|uniref:F-box domain-containing protein n=1 Tax=Collybiopsis confluens TaxID=2823264 RepID=A0A8H5HK03_9AGAR|nr:hypothetical protein D9757_007488 [Collybiopsis confluens]
MRNHVEHIPGIIPLPAVLGTNYTPLSLEISQLNDLLVGPQQELNCLGSEIARVQAILDDLLSKQQKVQIYVEAHRALMSPIRQLPSETLAEIFQWCLPLDVGYGVRSLAHAPLLLTTICRDWRRVAIETPRLWNSLHIFFPPYLGEDVQLQRIAGIELWVQRSGSLPISISLHGSSAHSLRILSSPMHFRGRQAEGGNILTAVMISLLSFRYKIQHIHIALNSPDIIALNELLVSSGSLFPSLLSFTLDDFNVGLYGQTGLNQLTTKVLPSLLSQMPALQSLDIRKLKIQSNIHLDTLHSRWDTLTNLSISASLSPADLFRIITKSCALQTLKVSVLVFEDRLDVSALTATLLDLVSLELNIRVNLSSVQPNSTSRDGEDDRRNRQLACTTAITSRIICPRLKQLYTSWSNILSPVSQVPILDFPLHALESLGVDIPMTPEALMECLELAPNLISLYFVDAGNAYYGRGPSTLQDTHLMALTPSADNPSPLCPQLRHLQIVDRSTGSASVRTVENDSSTLIGLRSSWSTHLLADFITARAKVKMLDSCELFFLHPFSLLDGEFHCLRAVKQEGKVKLRIHDTIVTQKPLKDGPMDGLSCHEPHYVRAISGGMLNDPSANTRMII